MDVIIVQVTIRKKENAQRWKHNTHIETRSWDELLIQQVTHTVCAEEFPSAFNRFFSFFNSHQLNQ